MFGRVERPAHAPRKEPRRIKRGASIQASGASRDAYFVASRCFLVPHAPQFLTPLKSRASGATRDAYFVRGSISSSLTPLNTSRPSCHAGRVERPATLTSCAALYEGRLGGELAAGEQEQAHRAETEQSHNRRRLRHTRSAAAAWAARRIRGEGCRLRNVARRRHERHAVNVEVVCQV